MSAADDLHDDLADDHRLAHSATMACHFMVEIGAGHDDVHALLQLLRLIEERLAARRNRMGELRACDGRAS